MFQFSIVVKTISQLSKYFVNIIEFVYQISLANYEFLYYDVNLYWKLE